MAEYVLIMLINKKSPGERPFHPLYIDLGLLFRVIDYLLTFCL